MITRDALYTTTKLAMALTAAMVASGLQPRMVGERIIEVHLTRWKRWTRLRELYDPAGQGNLLHDVVANIICFFCEPLSCVVARGAKRVE